MPIDEFQKIDEEYFLTVLEDDFSFEGNLKTEDSLMIKGIVKGTIESSDLIVIGPTSVINADIRAKNLQCFGKIIGNILVEEEVYFHTPSVIVGDISSPLLTIEKGCSINGKISMKSNADKMKGVE